MIEVKLSSFEMRLAAMVGVERQIQAVEKGLPNRHGVTDEDSWRVHIQGALGEAAFAKSIDRYYSGSVNTFKRGGDVGDIQVRTRARHDYDLLLRRDDRDTDVFVLVTVERATYRVWGWIRGVEAKRPEWLKEHGGREAAYFVPKEALRCIEAKSEVRQ